MPPPTDEPSIIDSLDDLTHFVNLTQKHFGLLSASTVPFHSCTMVTMGWSECDLYSVLWKTLNSQISLRSNSNEIDKTEPVKWITWPEGTPFMYLRLGQGNLMK